jgi:hypothetical protein
MSPQSKRHSNAATIRTPVRSGSRRNLTSATIRVLPKPGCHHHQDAPATSIRYHRRPLGVAPIRLSPLIGCVPQSELLQCYVPPLSGVSAIRMPCHIRPVPPSPSGCRPYPVVAANRMRSPIGATATLCAAALRSRCNPVDAAIRMPRNPVDAANRMPPQSG